MLAVSVQTLQVSVKSLSKGVCEDGHVRSTTEYVAADVGEIKSTCKVGHSGLAELNEMPPKKAQKSIMLYGRRLVNFVAKSQLKRPQPSSWLLTRLQQCREARRLDPIGRGPKYDSKHRDSLHRTKTQTGKPDGSPRRRSELFDSHSSDSFNHSCFT